MKQIIRKTSMMTIFCLLTIFAATAVEAATLTVTSTGDTTVGAAGCADGCSLREAITAAAAGDTINFSSLFNTAQTINTSSGLSIGKNLTITGTGARLLTVRCNVATSFAVFNITAGTVRISGITVSNGNNQAGGGSAFNTSNSTVLTLDSIAATGNVGSESAIGGLSGTITIINSLINSNSVVGVVADGTINIANSTISGNNGTSVGLAGGVYSNGGTFNLNNVTVANNINGGIENGGGTINIRNTIIAGSTVRADALGRFTSQGNNLVGNLGTATGFSAASGDKLNVAANLAALANNGGQTDTHALNTGSPAINAGNNCVVTAACGTNNPPVALTTDQRGAGFARQSGTAVDIGAFEALAPTAANVSITGRVLTASGRGITNATVTIYGDTLSEPRTVRTSSFGYYQITDLSAGETYVLEVRGKQFTFPNPTQVVTLTEDLAEINFTAN